MHNKPQTSLLRRSMISRNEVATVLDDTTNWSDDINDILDKIRINSIILSNEHKKTYFSLASKIKWFRIPVIVLSAVGSLFGFGLTPYLTQTVISELCSVLSLLVGLIGSLELFLGLSTKMENELIQSKELYLFAIEIQKTLLLDVNNRHCDGIIYLEDKFDMYTKFIQDSYLLECKIIDELTPLPKRYQTRINVDSIKDVENDIQKTEQQPKRRSLIKIINPKNIKNNKVEPITIKRLIDIKKEKSEDENDKKMQINNVENDVAFDSQIEQTRPAQIIQKPYIDTNTVEKNELSPSPVEKCKPNGINSPKFSLDKGRGSTESIGINTPQFSLDRVRGSIGNIGLQSNIIGNALLEYFLKANNNIDKNISRDINGNVTITIPKNKSYTKTPDLNMQVSQEKAPFGSYRRRMSDECPKSRDELFVKINPREMIKRIFSNEKKEEENEDGIFLSSEDNV